MWGALWGWLGLSWAPCFVGHNGLGKLRIPFSKEFKLVEEALHKPTLCVPPPLPLTTGRVKKKKKSSLKKRHSTNTVKLQLWL